MATEIYSNKKRGNEDYVEHSLRVMKTLMNLELDEEALVGAVLHEVCETEYMKNTEVTRIFGKKVGYIVNALSNKEEAHSGPSKEESEEYKFLLYTNRLLAGMQAEPFVLFIKMSDQIDLLDMMSTLDSPKQEERIREIETHFLPLYEKVAALFEPELKEKYDILRRKMDILLAMAKERLEIA